jgi:cytochrome P450
MGFGAGPRNCVGMRFAMEEMKIAICTMVQKFRFFPVKETPVRKNNLLLINYRFPNYYVIFKSTGETSV